MFAADAVARLSGTVGVAAVTAGPGNHHHHQNVIVCQCPVENAGIQCCQEQLE